VAPELPNGTTCVICDSAKLTYLQMTLTDGTVVDFVHCQNCEHRRWTAGTDVLSLAGVLERTRKQA
jgi:transcription elongation factor Elf1